MSKQITITNHAYKRARQRLGWNKKALIRMVRKVLEEGEAIYDKTELLAKWHGSDRANVMRMYGENLFLFDRTRLITVYRAPGFLIKRQ